MKSLLVAFGVIFLTFTLIPNAVADDSDIVIFPYQKQPCTPKLIGAVCCQGIRVIPIDFNKTVCIGFQLKLIPVSAVITITLDNNTVGQFTIDPNKPPTYCIPMIVPVPVAMCLRLHDIKLVGLGLQICSTIYVNYETNQVFSYPIPCIQLTTTGFVVSG